MTLQEFTAAICAELREAGFDARELQGFPIVQRPEGMAEGVRLLKYQTKFCACDREIYAEGMIFLPAGSRRAADELAAEKHGKL